MRFVVHKSKRAVALSLRLIVLAALFVPLLTAVPDKAFAATATDDFNRANGSLGSNWTDMTDGGMAISSQQIVGTNANNSGDIRTGETYNSDQFSQIEVTSTQLSGGQWVGPTVRSQNGGQNLYLGLYWWNNGNPVLMVFKRMGGGWTQLGSTFSSGALAAGTQLKLSVTGSSLTFSENGVAEITATDTSLTGGAPGVMAFGTPTADNWTGGDNSAAGTYSVGGAVSGLTGTVTLQNNAANDLNVSANGSFTFSSLLANGAGYNVTVKTNPTGQTCTVANGSGTIASANVSNVSVTCTTNTVGSASDNFNRANGNLGANWTDMTDGGLAISSNAVVGTTSGNTGDIRTGETYTSDQTSQVEVTSTQLSGGQWIGPAVRAQNGGQNLYLGLYWWNGGNPVLMVFKRMGGGWTQLGFTYSSGALAAGTQLQIAATGSNLTFSVNGVARITATDTSLTGGAPAIIANGAPAADNWVGSSTGTPPPTTYSVGGTASGLSGTVVLQDNSGDDLSVTANGGFTFGTQLATGAAYNVTVKTNPTGQTCTVSNASGTIATANVTNVGVSCSTSTNGSGTTDNFNRANGSLGTGWTDITDGGLAISSNVVVGSASGNTGDIRTGESYTNDQTSQIEVTSAQLSGGQWIGPAVRAQNGGQNAYLGIYFWNNGSPDLMLFKRLGGGWTQLGGTYASGALAAGTQLQLAVSGSNLTFSANGVARITATDTSLTGGAPGIIAYQAAAGDNWVGQSADAPGIYSVGGTVSGLSGTVTLQNNGGNDLSVGANGSFTFSSLLAAGAAYSVTVKTNPTGQSCAVTNGSGTIASANVSNVGVTCTTNTVGSGTDNFNRSNGPLGANWTDMTDGGMTISAQAAVGPNAGTTGDIRTAETYPSDQYSQIEVSSTQLTGGQWIGTAVRAQNGGQSLYLGIYYWNNGAPELMMFKRSGSSWTQLGNAYSSGALSAGTQLKLMVVGNTLSFLENGVERVAAGDSSYTGGAPGIMSFGTSAADNWAGGGAGFEVHYLSTDASGIESYDVISDNNGYGPQVLRVLRPTHPAAGVAHNFLYALPVEAGLGTSFGDGMSTLAALDAQDQYNLTIVEPSFNIEPWFANNPNDPRLQYETFMSTELQPWVKANLATTGTEQHWLIGFSKSGIGGEDLILKHPDLFTLAASWDFPADMSTYNQYGPSSSNNYGTDANFQANYRLSQSFLDAHKTPFLTNNRIWIGGYSAFQQDVTDYNALLTTEGIAHTMGTPQTIAHRWDSGWVPNALAGLYQDSLNQH